MPRPRRNRQGVAISQHERHVAAQPIEAQRLQEMVAESRALKEQYLIASARGDTPRVEVLKGQIRDFNERYRAAMQAAAIKDAVLKGQLPGKNLGEPTGQVKERIVEPSTKTPRRGTDQRHREKGKFKLVMAPDSKYLTAYVNAQVFSRTGNSMLNRALQDGLGYAGTLRLVEALGGIKQGVEVLREEAHVIGPVLTYFERSVGTKDRNLGRIDEIKQELRDKRNIAGKFASEEEFNSLIDRLARQTKVPGWIPISMNLKAISELTYTKGPRLTADEVLARLGPQLQRSAAEIKAKYEQRVGEEEREIRARRKAAKDKEEFKLLQADIASGRVNPKELTRGTTVRRAAPRKSKTEEYKKMRQIAGFDYRVTSAHVNFSWGSRTARKTIFSSRDIGRYVRAPNGVRYEVVGATLREATQE